MIDENCIKRKLSVLLCLVAVLGSFIGTQPAKVMAYTVSGVKARQVSYPNGDRFDFKYHNNETVVEKYNYENQKLYEETARMDKETGYLTQFTDSSGVLTFFDMSYGLMIAKGIDRIDN